MNPELESSIEMIKQLKELKDSGKKEFFNNLLNNIKNLNLCNFTNLELNEVSKELKDFIKENGLLVSSFDKYGFSEPFEDFNYSLSKLKSHLTIIDEGLWDFYWIIKSNPKKLFDTLKYNADEFDGEMAWKDFEYRWTESHDIICYEQALINLLALFEAFMSNMLKWIYINDEEFIKSKKTLLSFEDVLKNYESILSFFVNEYVDNIRDWERRQEAFNKPLRFNLKERPENIVIQEAIDRRNLLIHHSGKVNKKYFTSYPNSTEIGSRLETDKEYYFNVQQAVETISKLVEEKVSEKINKNSDGING